MFFSWFWNILHVQASVWEQKRWAVLNNKKSCYISSLLCFFIYHCSVKPPFGTPGYLEHKSQTSVNSEVVAPPWQGRSIAGPKLRLCEFSAFLEQTRDPDNVSRLYIFLLYIWIRFKQLIFKIGSNFFMQWNVN